jgi:prepilin-type N-terminal cleavage/methylation domain-containing protein
MSKKTKKKNRKGFTLIELMIGTVLGCTVLVGVGAVLVDSQRGWNAMYERAYCDITTDAHVARRMFDSVVRNASDDTLTLDENGGWVEVYSYSDPNLAAVDLYSKFQENNGELTVEYGELENNTILGTETICRNVSNCVFKVSGRSVQMILTLDDGDKSITVVASAVMHN